MFEGRTNELIFLQIWNFEELIFCPQVGGLTWNKAEGGSMQDQKIIWREAELPQMRRRVLGT